MRRTLRSGAVADLLATTCGRRTPSGGSTGSPPAPTPSTRSRSCRSPPRAGGRRRVLDVGCGDGQVSRLAAELGAEVDRHRPHVELRQRGPRARRRHVFARAGAGALPFADASFDAVVACLVFEHIRDVDDAIAEVARVLQPGGRFCFFLNHPLLQTPNSGWIDDQFLDPPEQYWRIGAVPRRGRDDRGGGEGRVHPVHPPPAQPLHQHARRQRAAARADGGAGAAGRVPRQGRGVPRGGHHPAAAVSPHAQGLRPPYQSSIDGRHPAHHRHVRRRSLRRRGGAGGPRLVRHRQPAHLAGRHHRRAGQQARQRHRAAGAGRRPPARRAAARRSPRCAPTATGCGCCSSTRPTRRW